MLCCPSRQTSPEVSGLQQSFEHRRSGKVAAATSRESSHSKRLQKTSYKNTMFSLGHSHQKKLMTLLYYPIVTEYKIGTSS